MRSPQSKLAVDFVPGLPFPNSPRSPRLRVRFFFFSSKVAVIPAGALMGGICPEFESRGDAEARRLLMMRWGPSLIVVAPK